LSKIPRRYARTDYSKQNTQTYENNNSIDDDNNDVKTIKAMRKRTANGIFPLHNISITPRFSMLEECSTTLCATIPPKRKIQT
jgi:hypothetical protein